MRMVSLPVEQEKVILLPCMQLLLANTVISAPLPSDEALACII